MEKNVHAIVGVLQAEGNSLASATFAQVNGFELKIQVPGIIALNSLPLDLRVQQEQELKIRLALIECVARRCLSESLKRKVFPIDKALASQVPVLSVYPSLLSEQDGVQEGLEQASVIVNEKTPYTAWVRAIRKPK